MASIRASEPVSVASLEPFDHSGWLTKQGGAIKTWKRRLFVLKGRSLYYFKSSTDVEETGLIELEPSCFVREEPAKSSKRKYMMSIGTQKRVYYMYSEVKAETDAWVQLVAKAIKGGGSTGTGPLATAALASGGATGSPDTPSSTSHSSNTTTTTTHSNNNNNNNNNNNRSNSTGGSGVEGSAAGGTGGTPVEAAGHVAASKLPSELLPFMGGDAQLSEFFTIWTESIPLNCEPQFTLAVSANSMDAVQWRVVGSQAAFIQKMVDFFWNVGAPEEEIDKLNDIGARLNPSRIGSFVEMSAAGGMDGGWYFPVEATIEMGLEAADQSEASSRLAEFAHKHGIADSVVAVGRDMGAAPPRQTDVLFDVLPSIEVAFAAFDSFGFPSVPGAVKEALAKCESSTALRVVLSSDGFVRLSMVLSNPAPSTEDINRLAGALELGPLQDETLRERLGAPQAVELQYLMEAFGYNVYKTAWDVKEVFPLSLK